jgi:hypothetical protein
MIANMFKISTDRNETFRPYKGPYQPEEETGENGIAVTEYISANKVNSPCGNRRMWRGGDYLRIMQCHF